jgi:hypothetical protein
MRPHASAVLLGLTVLTAPVHASVEKFLLHCQEQQKLCAFFRPSVSIPDGWVEDKEATRYFKAVMMLPKNVSFDDSPVKIYAVAVYNRDKRPIAAFLPDAIADWKGRAKDAKIVTLPELARGTGKPVLVRRSFDSAKLKEQGHELQAVTTDADKDGNEFVVTITLSANSREALKSAEAAYMSILEKY